MDNQDDATPEPHRRDSDVPELVAPETSVADPRPTWRAWPILAVFVVLVIAGGLTLGSDDSRRVDAQGAPTPPSAASATEAPTTTVAPTTTTAPTTTVAPTTTTAAAVTEQLLPATVTPVGPVDGAVPSISRVATTDPVIFVTIDDGQVADPRVLEYLTTTRMPVTMFLNDSPARAHRDYFEALRLLGNSVNSHTQSHTNLKKLGPEQQRAEICGMVNVLNELFGTHGGFFRAPYGDLPASARRQAATCGIRAALQWKGTLNGGVLALQEESLKPGDIILGHFNNTLYEDLVEIKRQADAAGLRIARVEDYLPAA